MRKIIAAINMTLDGFCDHTAIIPDEEIHQHYTELLLEGDAILYGRITYQLMEYWIPLAQNPSGEKSIDDFTRAIDAMPKIVFSHTLKQVDWSSARIASQTLEAEVSALKKQPGRDIFAGSRNIILQLLNLDLLDEFQLCIHPVLAGSGLPLFDALHHRTPFKLLKTKTFRGGAVLLYYEPIKSDYTF